MFWCFVFGCQYYNGPGIGVIQIVVFGFSDYDDLEFDGR